MGERTDTDFNYRTTSMIRSRHIHSAAPFVLAVAALTFPRAVRAQFDEVPIPPQLAALDFMVGEWRVEGTFRTPDHIAPDRTLWYTTRGGGVTRFDGRSWTAFVPGESALADSIRASIREPGEPYAYGYDLSARWIQDGFALLVDEGRTSGTTIIHFDTAEERYVATSLHAATNGINTTLARAGASPVTFEGRGVDRRGERTFRRRYEAITSDGYVVRTDVSFDEGVTWLDDQIVQTVRRR